MGYYAILLTLFISGYLSKQSGGLFKCLFLYKAMWQISDFELYIPLLIPSHDWCSNKTIYENENFVSGGVEREDLGQTMPFFHATRSQENWVSYKVRIRVVYERCLLPFIRVDIRWELWADSLDRTFVSYVQICYMLVIHRDYKS